MPADRDSRPAVAQATLDVLRAAGSALGRLRGKEQAVQQTMQLDVWEDEGGASARPRFWNPVVPALPVL
jgi:hypothetical protein